MIWLEANAGGIPESDRGDPSLGLGLGRAIALAVRSSLRSGTRKNAWIIASAHRLTAMLLTDATR
jgi:hypothetical protein